MYPFSPDTVMRMNEFYERVKHLPYKPGAWEGVYGLYTALPDWNFIPLKVLDYLPTRAMQRAGNNTIWKLIFMGVFVSLGLALTSLVFLFSR